MRMASIALKVAAAVLMVALTFLVADVGSLARQISRDEPQVAKNINDTLAGVRTTMAAIQGIETDTNRTEQEIAGLVSATRHSVLTKEQVQELVAHGDALMANADFALAQIGAAAASVRGLSPAAQDAIKQFAEDAHDTMAGSQQMIKAATDDLSAPEIKQTLGSLAETSAGAAQTTKNVQATTQDIRDYVHRETTPIRGTWNMVKSFLLGIAGPLAQVAAAAK